MDLINDKLSKIYLKYLAAAFGSAFMGSVFGLADRRYRAGLEYCL